jgi:hypothetical protein
VNRRLVVKVLAGTLPSERNEGSRRRLKEKRVAPQHFEKRCEGEREEASVRCCLRGRESSNERQSKEPSAEEKDKTRFFRFLSVPNERTLESTAACRLVKWRVGRGDGREEGRERKGREKLHEVRRGKNEEGREGKGCRGAESGKRVGGKSNTRRCEGGEE